MKLQPTATQCREMTGGWSGEERGILAALYPVGGAKAVQEEMSRRGLPVRGWNSIKSRAARDDIRYDAMHEQTEPADWPVPVHEYTEPDVAVRDWRCGEPGQLLGRVA